MDGFSSWIEGHLNIIQTIGLMASLFLTAAVSRREAKAQEIENILTLSEHHHKLWGGVGEKRELQRIFQTDQNTVKSPPNVAEEVFINEAIAHYMTGWRIAKAGGITTLNELAVDVKWFFSLPLPRAVWEKTKGFKNSKFVQFVEEALK